MSFRKILSCMLLFITVNLFLPNLCLSSSSEITSISQLNNPAYRIGADILGPVLERTRKNLPNAEILNFNDFISQSLALQNGKIDALVCNESELISAMKNGLENVRILPGYVGEPVPTAAGISERSKIPGLTEKFNAFIAELKADGTLQEMYKRWVDDNNTNMPVIDVPEKSDIHLTIGTTGLVMPFSFYINSDVTGFDIELGRRFAAAIGATVEFKIYGFGSILMALKSGAIDIALSNLYVTPETEESVKFSDVIFNVNCVAVVRDEGKISAGNFSEFNGKRIGVFTGSVQYDMVRKSIPDAEILYFDSIANTINSLTSGKIDAAAIDETIALDIERENPVLTHTNQILGYNKTAFLFPMSIRNNSLLDEINEYIRRMKSDGTLEQIYALWSGSDESKKIIPDYSNFPDTKGVIHIAVDNETPVFSYMKDGKHVGYDVDIILRFCKEKGYRPEFNIINFTGVIPAVNSGKCDMGIGGITITPERSESVRFSEPVCNVRSIMLILKKEPMKKTESRRPKYSSLTEFDGKPIGMQPGIADWEDWVAKNLPHSKVHYFNAYPDFVSALKTHKIEGFLVDAPVLALMAAEDNMLTAVDEPIGEPFGYSFVYALNEHGKKLCDEMSEYIRRIKSNGELDAILSKWQGADEAKKIPPDFKNLPAEKGTLTFAAEGNYPPFNYYKGTKLAGIDIELAVKFCKAYGYGLEVQIMAFDAMIPAAHSGKIDFASDFTPSDEHEEAVYFSESYCDMRSVMACLKADDSLSYTNADSLEGKIIGVQTGTTCAELVPQKIPSAKLAYYDSLTDQLTALKAGKVDAICCSLPAAIFAQNEDPRLTRINPPLRESYLYPIFAQTEQAKKFCDEYSEFLKKLWDDGTIDALNAKWLGADESKKILDDYSQLPAMNGTIKMAVDASMIPFAYMRDNKIVGYDIDLAVMFCKSKGYALVVENMPLTAAIASVKSGKSDFSQSMNQTKERSENTLFTSTPAMKSGNVLLTMKKNLTDEYSVNIRLSEFAGKKIGIHTGTNSEIITAEKIPSAKLVYYDSQANMLAALSQGKIDAMSCGKCSAVFLINNSNDLAYVSEPLRKNYRSVVFVSSDKGLNLRNEYGEFLKTLWDNGTIDKLFDKWVMNNDESQKGEDYSNLPASKGTLKMAADTAMMPFVYIKDNRIQGYDIDLAVMFCRAKGYGLEIISSTHSGVLASIASGKCDFSYAMEYTEERAKSVLFSEVPNIEADNVLVIMKPADKTSASSVVSNENEPSFWDDIALSFRKTFIREDRWKLFIEGIINTMIITVSSIFSGMLLGFIAFMFCRTGSVIANVITKFSVWLIKGTPIVVLLMILYYVIFGHVNISGIIVSIIAFTLTFGTSVYRMLTFGTGAVEKGQTEAAYALGFTDMQTFFTVILPQAALHFMPSFKEEVTMLIKSTSVVGYIAVQDLTKMGDIVRSRTYEAFFPLIAVAVIYFVLAGMLNIIVDIIHVRITPSKRKAEDILKGIDTSKGDKEHDKA